ncbi:MAG: NADH-quinone oxidoreductase subunit C [Deltaproteobacteria bacterium]
MLKDNLKKALGPMNLEKVAEGEYAKTGYHLEVTAQPDQMVGVAQAMLEAGCFLESFTAVDLVESFDLVYHFANFDELCRTAVHVPLGKKKGMYTITQVYPGADWYEREVFDLFGIHFFNHPNLKRLLLPEDADFHPLLKDFKADQGND